MEEEGMNRRIVLRVNSIRQRAAERVRRIHKRRDGPPLPSSMDAYLASKGFKPQPIHAVGYENIDPAILAYIPERIRTGSGPMSQTMPPPPPTLSAIIAATTGYRAQVKGGTVPNNDLGKSSETLLENLKLKDIHISN